MTLDETADYISVDLPKWQRDANYEFVLKTYDTITLGGCWIYPSWGLIFRKTEEGFELDETFQDIAGTA